jgi:hypothetical protein
MLLGHCTAMKCQQAIVKQSQCRMLANAMRCTPWMLSQGARGGRWHRDYQNAQGGWRRGSVGGLAADSRGGTPGEHTHSPQHGMDACVGRARQQGWGSRERREFLTVHTPVTFANEGAWSQSPDLATALCVLSPTCPRCVLRMHAGAVHHRRHGVRSHQ